MSINQNSWKSIQFDILGATIKRIDFEKVFDGKNFVRPNFIQLKNLNSSDILYIGDDKNISSTNYRLSINPLATGKSINIDGYSNVYILCASNTSKLEINYAYDDSPSASDLDGTQDITIINQSLTVSNVGISSIASGNNTIGKVYLTDGTDDAIINADGSQSVKDVVLGEKTDDKSASTDTTSVSVIQLLKQISYMLQNPESIIVSSLDGGIDTLGATTEDKSSATDTTSISVIQILKQISYMLQNPAVLPAGTNLIGGLKVYDSAGTNLLKVNADGSLDVNFSGTVNATSVQIKDSTDTYFLNIDSSGYITSKIAGSIPAGTNVIGNVGLEAGANAIGSVDIDGIATGQNVKPATTPTIYNVTCTLSSTEYSQALPANCKSFSIGLKSKLSSVDWVLKFATSGTEFSFNGSETYSQDNILFSSQTLFFESSSGGEVIQIIAYS